LIQVSLNTDVHYAALSYACGDDAAIEEVFCNNKSMIVKPNLYDALWRLQLETPQDLFWVDAVCIHQNDKEEKAVQIRVMTKIYQQAQHVYIRLGREMHSDFQAVQLCMKICNVFASKVSYSSIPNRSELEACDLPMVGLPRKESIYWNDLRNHFRKPWFSRAWVVQECIVTRSSIMLCGLLQIGCVPVCYR
jgi:Heterokaryon incompatibility protein (HET)